MSEAPFPPGLKIITSRDVPAGEMYFMVPDGLDQPADWERMTLEDQLEFAKANGVALLMSEGRENA